MSWPEPNAWGEFPALEGHAWTGHPGALCECGWTATTHVRGIHEDWRRHLAAEAKLREEGALW